MWVVVSDSARDPFSELEVGFVIVVHVINLLLSSLRLILFS